MTATLPQKAKDLIDDKLLVVLTTVNPDGSPQTTPVWAMRDGEDVLISTLKDRKKGRNMARDGRVSLLVLDPSNAFSYFSINGSAAVADDPDGNLIQDLAQKYIGGPYTMDEGTGNVRVKVRVTPDRVSGQ